MMLMRRRALTLIAAISCVCAAGGTAAAALVRDTAPGPVAQARVPLGPAKHQREREPRQRVVCPGITWKIGISVELPCGRGAKILRSAIVEVNGGYCAKVTYIAQVGLPPRTKRVCETAEPSARDIARPT